MPCSIALALLLGTASAFTSAGCGGEDWQAETYPARGRITINGESPAGAVIELHSIGEQPDVRNSRPWAVVQGDGSYALSTYEQGDGAPPGEYAVAVRWPPDVSQPSLADRLGGAYANAQKSPWKVTIDAEDNELPLIEITGVNVAPKDEAGQARQAPPGPMMNRRPGSR